jgi:perosamine synthetase
MTLPVTRPAAAQAPQLPHPPEWPVYEEATIAAVGGMLRRGRSFDYGYGDELAELESAFARYHGRTYALALNSGTAALLAAYFALGVEEGDEVVGPVFTFFATVTPLFLLGAVPVLVDSAPVHGNVDVEQLFNACTERTKALVVTHLWGNPCPMDELVSRARALDLPLVEDCSHAHGATYRGRRVGSHADIAVFSIGGHKAVSGGLGGMLLTDDADLYARACLFANFRHRTDLTIDRPGYAPFLETGLGGNFRVSPVAAVLALEHLRSLDAMVARRQANMDVLLDAIVALPGVRAVPVEPGCGTGAWYDGVVEIGDDAPVGRDRLAETLRERGLKVRAPATRPLHHYAPFRGAAPEWAPRTARAARRAAELNSREFPRAQYLFDHWLRLPVNFLYEEGSTLPEWYAEAFVDVFDRSP